ELGNGRCHGGRRRQHMDAARLRVSIIDVRLPVRLDVDDRLEFVRRADERAGIWKKFDAAFATPDPRERFRACLAAWFDFVPYIYPVASDLIRLRATDEEAAAAWDDRMDDLRRAFRQLIRGLDKAGELASHWSVAKAADFLWAGSSVESWGLLTRDCSWSEGHAAKTITAALERALLR
ncbi:hypothetical protein, partial [Parvibaculum sp.]|uniref:hypothetical protein n=1 Tax=Parvibaculum sp. TaxID=2024848 RepID=UPI0025E9DB25